jgi:hypothetical protein
MIETTLCIELDDWPLEKRFEAIQVRIRLWQFLMSVTEDILQLWNLVAQEDGKRRTVFSTAEVTYVSSWPLCPGSNDVVTYCHLCVLLSD